MAIDDFVEVKEKPFYQLGGNLPADAPSYVRRAADMDLLSHLMAGRFCYVLTSRQMGKSSLMVQTARRLRESGARVAVLDLTRIGQNLSPEQWYDGLLIPLGREFNLEDELDDYWNSDDAAIAKLGPMQRWMTAVREVILKAIPNNVVIFVDEIDAVRGLPFSTDEFFSGIRQMFNERTFNPDLERITFCLLGVAKPSDLVRNINTTPFNVGYRIELTDFTEEEASPLLDGLGHDPATAKKLLGRVLWWTGGHPYLTQRLCSGVAADPTVITEKDVDRVCTDIFLSSRAREKDDNLLFVRERVLRSELDRASLLDLYERVHEGKSIQDDDSSPLIDTLRLAGIVKVAGNKLVVRNRIYAYVFDKTWIQHNMPDAELRRQKRAFRKGLTLAATLSAVVLGIIAIFAGFAIYERNITKQTALRTAARNYDADMTSAGDAFDRGDFAAGTALLKRWMAPVVADWQKYVPPENRVRNANFEWGWLWSRYSGESTTTYWGHWGPVRTVAISSDGKWIVTAGADATVRVLENGAACADNSVDPSKPINLDSTAKVSDPNAPPPPTGPQGFPCLPVRSALALYNDGPKVFQPGTTDWLKLSALYRADHREIPPETPLGTNLTPSGISTVQFSPDNAWIAILSRGGASPDRDDPPRGYLWNRANPRQVVAVPGAPVGLHFLSGTEFVTIDQNNIARRWTLQPNQAPRLESEQQQGTASASRNAAGNVNASAFSPDGHYYAMARKDGHLAILDTTAPVSQPLMSPVSFDISGLSSVTFEDDETVLIGGRGGNIIHIDRATFVPSHVMETGQGEVNSLTLSQDRKWLISSGSNSTLRVSRFAATDSTLDQADKLILKGHHGSVNGAAITPDGKLIVSVGSDDAVRFWEIPPPRMREPRRDPNAVPQFGSLPLRFPASDANGAVNGLAVDPNRSHPYMVYIRGNVTGSLQDEQEKQKKSPDRPAGVDAGDLWTKVLFYDFHSAVAVIPKIRWVPHWYGTTVAYSQDSRYVATGSSDGSVQLWEVAKVYAGPYDEIANPAYMTELNPKTTGADGNGLSIRSLTFAADGTLTAARTNGTLLRWRRDTATGRYQAVSETPDVLKNGASAFAASGRVSAICAAPGPGRPMQLQIWQDADLDLHRGQVFKPLVGTEAPREDSWTDDLIARWKKFFSKSDPQSDVPIHTRLSGSCTAVSFSPDGQWLAAGTDQGEIALWRTSDWSRISDEKYIEIYQLRHGVAQPLPHWPLAPASASAAVNSIAFSPDSNVLAYASADSRILLWDIRTARRLPGIGMHQGSVLGLAFTPNGHCLVSGGTDTVLAITPTASPDLTHMDWVPYGSYWNPCYE